MSKALAHFQKGVEVEIFCYKNSCENISFSATLSKEIVIHPSFVQDGGVGRLHWSPNAAVKGFHLIRKDGSDYLKCPGCNMTFGNVVVISNGRGKRATVFGYESE